MIFFYNPVHEGETCSQPITVSHAFTLRDTHLTSIITPDGRAGPVLCHQFQALNSDWYTRAPCPNKSYTRVPDRSCNTAAAQEISIFSPVGPWIVYFVMTKVRCFTITAVPAPTAKK